VKTVTILITFLLFLNGIASAQPQSLASCIGSLPIGDIVGAYSLNPDGTYNPAFPDRAARNLTTVDALNSATLQITDLKTGYPYGWVYVDQLGVRWVQLRSAAPEEMFERYGIVRGGTTLPTMVKTTVVLNVNQTLELCKPR
jgi:hypothetical protein